jgi:hypothetical protein
VYIVYCILYTVYCILCTVYCILYTVNCILYTVYCILYTVYCILYIVYCIFSCRRVSIYSISTCLGKALLFATWGRMRCGGMVPLILHFVNRREWQTSRADRLNLRWPNPLYPFTRTPSGPYSRSQQLREEKNLFPLPGIEPQFLGRLGYILHTIPITLSLHAHTRIQRENKPLNSLFLFSKVSRQCYAKYVLKGFVLEIHVTAKWHKTANDQTMGALSLQVKHVQRATI